LSPSGRSNFDINSYQLKGFVPLSPHKAF
jgi:hypothetical protein